MIHYICRNIAAAAIGLAMRRGRFRFSKDYRHGETRFHRTVYACVNTIAANAVADGDDFRSAIFWGFPRQARYY
jgi:hypothetical protein